MGTARFCVSNGIKIERKAGGNVKREDLKYDGAALEDMMGWVIGSLFTHGERHRPTNSPELDQRRLDVQLNGEELSDFVKTGMGSGRIPSYAVLALIRMMQRGLVEPMTIGEIREFFVQRYVGHYDNVGHFAEAMVFKAAEAKSVASIDMFQELQEYVDWREYAMDTFGALYWLISVNENTQFSDGSIYVFKKKV